MPAISTMSPLFEKLRPAILTIFYMKHYTVAMERPETIEILSEQVACCSPGVVRLPPDETVDRFARTLKALGHPVRLKIMHILSRTGGQVCVCDIERQFDLSQPTISHHLRLLREAGLVETEQRGPWVHYSVRPGEVDALARHFAGLAE